VHTAVMMGNKNAEMLNAIHPRTVHTEFRKKSVNVKQKCPHNGNTICTLHQGGGLSKLASF
jgi:hypothetical protein